MARINKQLQREISFLLAQRIKNDSVKSAIITGVDCSRDLERARVFFTSLVPEEREALLEELQSVKGPLRAMLGQVLRLRHIPSLEFAVDVSTDYGGHIDDILHRLGMDPKLPSDAGTEENYGEEDDDGNDA